MAIILPELLSGSVITSRVRLARNLKDYPFKVTNVAKAKDIVAKVNRALVKCDTFNLYYMSNLSSIQLEAMKEGHLISQALIDNKECGACLINKDKSLSVMVNEEDVIREQCFLKGLSLTEAYKKLTVIDDELSKNLNLAFDDRLGYLTACPTNLGTGLRASVMMFLPALTESGKINALIREVADLGLTVRGVYGEGSDAEGYMYQISNEVTLGVSEYEILQEVENTVTQICRAERDEMERIYVKRELKTMDTARKSYGILTNAVMLSYSEFLRHIADVKLGAMLGLISFKSDNDIEKIDELIVKVRPASLCESFGKRLNRTDRDILRAEVVSAQLKKL